MLGEGFVDALLGGSAAPSALDHLAATLTTSLLVLGDAAGGGDAAAVTDAAAAAADAAANGVKSGGFFGVFSDAFEAFLKVLDGGLEGMGVPYSYGFSIIVLTLLVKLATFPLSAKQVQSTLGLQAMQPRVKELQAKYANDPERIQVGVVVGVLVLVLVLVAVGGGGGGRVVAWNSGCGTGERWAAGLLIHKKEQCESVGGGRGTAGSGSASPRLTARRPAPAPSLPRWRPRSCTSRRASTPWPAACPPWSPSPSSSACTAPSQTSPTRACSPRASSGSPPSRGPLPST